MDTKANLANRRKINELASQHNKLTTLVACLLNELNAVKKELNDIKGSNNSHESFSKGSNYDRSSDHNSRHHSSSSNGNSSNNSNKFANFSDLRAEDILKQLSINNVDN
jgi:hypothetical protein